MNKVLIIAEAGVNHNGSLETAKKMIDAAKEAGADIVKFQTGTAENNISLHAPKAEYQISNAENKEESQFEMVRSLELRYEDYKTLKQYAENVGIQFLSTSFDIEGADYLRSIGVNLWKIPSGELTNYPYLVHIAGFGEPIILSTGMCTLEEVERAMNLLKQHNAGEIAVLHCTTEYPTPHEDANISAMLQMKKHFNCEVGYSDHTMGIEASIAAVALGATIIEKHFTLSRTMLGPDHAASLEPNELKQLVDSIRHIEVALGTGIKEPSPSEVKNIAIARKSIVAKRRIQKGEIFSAENVTVKRPGNGISPMRWNEVLGQAAIRDFEYDELIEL